MVSTRSGKGEAASTLTSPAKDAEQQPLIESELNAQEAAASSSDDSDSSNTSDNSGDSDDDDDDDAASTSHSSALDEMDPDSIYSGSDADVDMLFQRTVEDLKQREAEEEEAAAAAAAASKGEQGTFEGNEDEIRLEGASGESSKTKKGKKRDGKSARGGKSSIVTDKQMDAAFDRLKHGEELGEKRPKSTRQQQKERRDEKAKTAGPGWFDMPAFPGADKKASGSSGSLTKPSGGYSNDARGPTAEEMRREIQAIRLRNAIDPKRFYRGGAGRDTEMPKYAQLGRVISSHIQPSATLNRGERGKTVIDELVKDAEASAYAKRKFSEQQDKTNVAWSSHVRRYPKGRKKQRR